MGEHEGWVEPSGLLPNGLLPNAGPVAGVLDSERWLKAEERTAELIACIQPNPPSEDRRNAVADYVQRLIMKCFPCQVFTFGSVPLKTYLPDGDIDLTVFSNDQNLKDTWPNQVRDILEKEEINENAEFCVKEVQYIQAEVKLIKCLVENIVVDISFNQLGGLCTLCFLEEVDNLINQNHLFKRSIILIKAWCYYESRILGAHHGLISTYALETLVLYIFHVFNNSFAGPLEVLYRFLEFFSNFDWDNFCVSLWGPVPIRSLPDVTAESPRKDGGELLLSKLFLDACSSVYAVFPTSQENQGQPFVSKHFNVIDPLRVNNNLGRSVSKGNFFRIRSAFAFGATRLARLLDCPKENLIYEVNRFFMNTWDRHGSGCRPDAPNTELWHLRLSGPDCLPHSENVTTRTSGQKVIDKSSRREMEVDGSSRRFSSSRKGTNSFGNIHQTNAHGQSQMSHEYISSSKILNHNGRETNPHQGHRNLKSDHLVNDVHGRFLLARRRSSPELTDSYSDPSFQVKHNRAVEVAKVQASLTRGDGSNRRKNFGSETVSSHSGCSVNDDSTSVRHVSATDSNSGSNEELSSTAGAQGMQQEEQDLVNMMGYVSLHGFNGGQVHVPYNLASAHLPFPIPPSILASMGYNQRNIPGMVPANSPSIDPFTNLHFPPGLVSPPYTHDFPSFGMNATSEDSAERNNDSFSCMEMNPGEPQNDYWQQNDIGSTGGFDPNYRKYEMLQPENFQHQDNRGGELSTYERIASSRFSSAAHSNSLRSKASSESSWDGSSPKTSKSAKGKRGKNGFATELTSSYGKAKIISESVYNQAEDDDQEWDSVSDMATDITERSSQLQSVFPLPRYHHASQTSSSDSMIPNGPMLIDPGSRQRMTDSSGLVAFYPTGPPIPFLTMLPIYNLPPEPGEGLDNNDSGQNLKSSEVFDESEDLNTSNEHKSDILNGDFPSHWQNLQFGRFCQNPRYNNGSMIYPSPVMVPPVYLQGQFPWEGPGRPVSADTDLYTHVTGYGPRLVPVAPLQSVSSRPPNLYQHYVDDVPRYRGTGTYLPNPKFIVRDRHSSGTRRGNYHYDRNDNRGDRDGNWRTNPKSRERTHNRSQNEKSNSRLERLPSSENRANRDRPWSSYRHDSVPSNQSQNGVLHSNSINNGPSSSVAYGMYPLQAMSANGVSSNGPNAPPYVMLYPFDHNATFQQLEYGSLGPLGMNDQLHLSDGSRMRESFEERRFPSGSARGSSPDQPSSPHHQRRL